MAFTYVMEETNFQACFIYDWSLCMSQQHALPATYCQSGQHPAAAHASEDLQPLEGACLKYVDEPGLQRVMDALDVLVDEHGQAAPLWELELVILDPQFSAGLLVSAHPGHHLHNMIFESTTEILAQRITKNHRI